MAPKQKSRNPGRPRSSNRPTLQRTIPLPAPGVLWLRVGLAGLAELVEYDHGEEAVRVTAISDEAMDDILDRFASVALPCDCGVDGCRTDPAETMAALKRVRWGSTASDAGPVRVCPQYRHLELDPWLADELGQGLVLRRAS